MSVELHDLKPGTVFVDFTGQFAVVMSLNPRSQKFPFLYTNKAWRRSRGAVVKGTTYKGKLADVRAIVGSVDLADMTKATTEAQKGKSAPKPQEPLFGTTATLLPWETPDELKDVKKGDVIEFKHGRGIREVVFEGYNPKRPKYPITYRIHTGSLYKGQLSDFVRKVRDGEPVAV